MYIGICKFVQKPNIAMLTDDEIKKLDWQILIARLEMQNNAYLKMIVENQAIMIAEIKKIPISQVVEQMDAYIKEHQLLVDTLVKEKMPKYTYP